MTWSELYRAGKRLTLGISFDYKQIALPLARPYEKRSRTSATKTMLGERAVQIDAEEQFTGEPSVWRYVYKLMRCSGPPCHLGPHCWVDPDGKNHYRLKTHHLKALIKHIETGGILESHDDAPQSFREQIYAEEQHYAEKNKKQPITKKSKCDSTHLVHLQPPTPTRMMCDIPGSRDEHLKEYSEWQKTRYRDSNLQSEF